MNEYFTTDHYRLVYPNTMPPHYDYVDNPPDVFLPMSDPALGECPPKQVYRLIALLTAKSH